MASTPSTPGVCGNLDCVNPEDFPIPSTPPTFILNEVVYYVVPCGGETVLQFTGTLPSWVTVDVENNRLVGAAGIFSGVTQEAANAAAQDTLNTFAENAIAAGVLPCTPIVPEGVAGDDFESYSDGAPSSGTLDDGTGFGEPWVYSAAALSLATVNIGGIDDRRMIMSNGQAARKFLFPGSLWNTLRIGFRFDFDSTANIVGPPRWLIGLLSNPASGLSNGPFSAVTSHFVGIRTIGGTWFGGDNVYDMGGTQTQIYKRVGVTESTSAATAQMRLFGRVPATLRPIFLLEITKGSPNWTFQTVYKSSGTFGDDWTQAQLVTSLEDVALAVTGPSSVNYLQSSADTFPVDETDGELNAVCFAWDIVPQSVCLSEMFFRVIN